MRFKPVRVHDNPRQLSVKDFTPFNRRKGTGLGKDFDVFLNMIESSRLEEQAHGAWVVKAPGVHVHVEHMHTLQNDVVNIFVPNQELITPKDVEHLRSSPVHFVMRKTVLFFQFAFFAILFEGFCYYHQYCPIL